MRVLLATDFSEHAQDAARLVKGLSLPEASVIRVVHVIEPFPEISVFAPAAMLSLGEAAERETRNKLERVAATLRAPGRDVESVVAIGRVADVIVEQAERPRADLIVIGSRGRRAIASAVLGSVSAEVVDRAPCPVLVARGPSITRTILAEDGSDTSAAGARLVTTCPALRGLPVRVVSVVDAPLPSTIISSDAAMGTYSAVQAYYDALPELRETTGRVARERAEELTVAGVNATFEVREGDAAAELIAAAAANRADCLVIGSHGRTGISRLFLGSVARAVLFHAPCSVLIARGTDVAERDRREAKLAASS